MSGRKLISSGSPYERSVGFSRAVRIGNAIHVSGTAPIGKPFPEDAYGQAKLCLKIIADAIAQAGGDIKDVVRTRTYLVRAEDYDDIARAHGEVFGEIRPASTMVIVAGLLRPEWLVEIEADAVIAD